MIEKFEKNEQFNRKDYFKNQRLLVFIFLNEKYVS